MKKITYKTLKITNFLSVGNDVVEINYQNGFNLITGNNIDNPDRKNGTGKSTIINAQFFALYGDVLKKIKKEYIVNNITKGKGNVELEFDVETDNSKDTYLIKRQVKPSKVELWKNGEDITLDSIGNNKDFIVDLIGTNAETCKQCDILSMNDKKNPPFMAMSPEEKRKFINNIFSLEIFGKMTKDLKDIIRENNKDISTSSTKIDEISNTLETLNKQKEAYKKKQEERAQVLKERKEKLLLQIKENKENLKKYQIEDVSKIEAESEKILKAIEKIDGAIGQINNSITEINTKKKISQDDLRKASSVEGAKCSKCLQDIPHSHLDHLESIKEELQTNIDKLSDHLKKFENDKGDWITKKGKFQEKLRLNKNQIDKAKSDQREMLSIKERIKTLKESLLNLEEDEKEDEPIFDENIKETEERKEKESEKLDEYQQYSKDLDICKFMLSEEGVKSFVVKKLLSMLNSSIQQYINDLGMTIQCRFDEFFDEQMTNNKGKEISYWNLSGGESRTIDLACAWAFKDIKRKISGVSSNLEFHDECYDSTLDALGVDLLISLVKRRIERDNLAVYAVSHRSETLKHVDGETVIVEMENNITRRV
jgi:DNA repair exonuclease SbcCD ATPase subunit